VSAFRGGLSRNWTRVGLRFMPVKAANTNVRIDYAWGKDGGALYISVGEAF